MIAKNVVLKTMCHYTQIRFATDKQIILHVINYSLFPIKDHFHNSTVLPVMPHRRALSRRRGRAPRHCALVLVLKKKALIGFAV